MLESYLKIAFQVLRRRWLFTLVSLFGVSLTLVVLMVATAVLDEMFGPQPPEAHADRTLGVYQLSMHGPGRTSDSEPSYWFLDRYLRTLPDVERVTLFSSAARAAAYREGEKVDLFLKRADGEFWRVYDFDFLEGGPFTSGDDARAEPVAVVNATTRLRLWDGAPALGRSLEVDGQRFRVVGVVADVSYLREDPFADVWVPISTHKSDLYRQPAVLGDFTGVVLARSRRDFPAIKRAFAARLPEVELPEPYEQLIGAADTRLEHFSRNLSSDHLRETPRPWRLRLAVVLAMVLFMVLPSLNLVNLNVSRILERSSEIGVRKAFGASSWTLVGQFVVENLLLTLIGGALAFALSGGVLALLSQTALIPYATFQLNFRVFLYGLLIALVFGLVSGVYPAFKMSRLSPVTALRRRSL